MIKEITSSQLSKTSFLQNRTPQQVQELNSYLKQSDGGQKALFLITHGYIKSFKGYCRSNGYLDNETLDFKFLPKYADYLSGIAIKGSYESYVKERIKDIQKDLKSLSIS